MDGVDQIVCTAIVGKLDDPAIVDRLAAFDHHRIETVVVATTDAARRRLRVCSDHGSMVRIALDRSQQLSDGVVLELGADRLVVVRLAAETATRVRPRDVAAALRLGHRAGSLHWGVSFEPEGSMTLLGVEQDDATARLADLFADGSVRWD